VAVAKFSHKYVKTEVRQ